MPVQSANPTPPGGDASSLLSQAGRSAQSTEFYSPVPPGYQTGRHRYVAVFGTVMSGLGKGIFSASCAKLLKDKGFSVAPIKMEGYLNIDSGTLNPYRHGEVFVLDDGTECDMDLGTYERMLDQNLSRANFVTSGQIYTAVLERERKGAYLGRDVQMIPHVTGEVKMRLRQLAATGGPGGTPADVVFVEVGGTVGDYENSFYIEAMREIAFEEGPGSTCFVALTYVIEPQILGEQKSKAAQLGIKRLMEAGIQPHIVACRAHNPVNQTVLQKIAMFSNVPLKRVVSLHDRESIYLIPDSMRAEGIDREILSVLNLHDRVNVRQEDAARRQWDQFVSKLLTPRASEVTIGITGKYAALRDAYASIDKAIEHASAWLGTKVNVRWIEASDITRHNCAEYLGDDLHGIIVPGGFGERGVEGKIACVEHARTQKLPYFGLCLGFQMAVLEYARNVLGIASANSTEFDPAAEEPIISVLPEQKKIEGLGGTMRLGAQDVALEPGSLASRLFGNATMIRQRFRHRYEVDPQYIDRLVAAGMRFSGRHPKQPIMQIHELDQSVHPFFLGTQFHPELTSRPLDPHPFFVGFLAAAMVRANPALSWEQLVERWTRPNTGNEKNHLVSKSTGQTNRRPIPEAIR